MAAPVIQVEYDRLSEVATGFGRNADATTALQGQVQRSAQALRQGGWQGRGSTAFFAEMDGKITPAVQRLTAALREAQKVSTQIGYLMRQAEEEAARPFRGPGVCRAGGRSRRSSRARPQPRPEVFVGTDHRRV
jgi:WXG100 family type VII secretion target